MADWREVFESYELHLDCLQRFFQEFSDEKSKQAPYGSKKYLNQLQRIANGESSTLEVSVDDLMEFFPPDGSEKAAGMVDSVLVNTKRYVMLMYEAAEKVKNEATPPTSDAVRIRSSRTAAAMEQANVPVNLRVPFEIHVCPPACAPVFPVRQVRASHVGSLVNLDALVTKVSSVKPRIQVAAYRCNDCGAAVFQSVDGPSYMPLAECSASSCLRNKAKGDLQLMIRECTFVKYQELVVQEPSHHVPQGCIPRNLKIVVEGELTRKLSPGTSATLSGVLLPVAKAGFAALRAGLVADTYFEVHHINVHKKGYGEELELSEEEMETFLNQYNSEDLYDRLSESIAPAICGHEDVKKAILLQLVGGVTEKFQDCMKIRGDIHMLLMGDPGVAKSQLLRQVCSIAPRAHYTTGKGSSGVGLTASVTKDAITGEFVLEGGAIVLADNGVCCIDEFDKMDESDRTAIHEVMEQQTVSVAKAGLTTTLNARTCILAAANPVYGRYDLRKSPVANMNLPASLLSRFDIQFLLLDRPDVDKDTELAKHVLHVHRHGSAPALQQPPAGRQQQTAQQHFDAKTMRMFIARARRYSPKLPPELMGEIVEHYVGLRARERQEREREVFRGCTTPRTLLAILRMSQALARLRRSEVVDRGDFEEALRLMQASKDSVAFQGQEDDADGKGRPRGSDFRTEIMEMISDVDKRFGHRRDWDGWIDISNDIEQRLQHMGFTPSQLQTTLEEYVELDVLVWKDHSKTALAFVERLEAVAEGEEE